MPTTNQHASPDPVSAPRRRAAPRGTLGGSNRLLSARQVAELLGVPESTVRLRWRAWNLPAYKIGKHLRWKERDVHAWIDNQTA
jgi:excisionase family DNA binding protein